MSDALHIIEAATRAAEPTELDEAIRFHTVVAPGGQDEAGSVQVIDLEAVRDELEYRHRPRRKKGTYRVHDADSLVAYLAKHADADSEVWADTVEAKIVGVIDAHRQEAIGDGQRHEEHRVEYAVLHTKSWKAWIANDGKLVDQSTFAELIEDRSLDIVRPSAADMLELAQSFRATTDVSFKSSKRLGNGERQFEFREQVDAGAGRDGQMEIPETFDLALQPFEGAERFKVTARFRYRINNGHLAIGYKLERPEDVLREAFLDVVGKVQSGVTELDRLNSPIFLGSR